MSGGVGWGIGRGWGGGDSEGGRELGVGMWGRMIYIYMKGLSTGDVFYSRVYMFYVLCLFVF